MSKHTTYRGRTIDMDAMRRSNETVTAVGNASSNAKGDKLNRVGQVTKTAEEIAREKGRTQSVIINTGVKGPMPEAPKQPEKVKATKTTSAQSAKKQKETELPSGDIVVDDNSEEQGP